MQDYLRIKKEIKNAVIEYLDDSNLFEEKYENLITLFKNQKIKEKKNELTVFLHMISKIANNHFRSHDFFGKIEHILRFFNKNLKNSYSNFELFNIFKTNKQILLYLIEENILKIDRYIANIITKGNFLKENYPFYFFNEIKVFIDENMKNEMSKKINGIENYEQKLKIGENDNLICKLIQNDSINEFISLHKRTKFSLSSKVEPSIFETNSFLIKNNPTLIEYAVFHNSIQIFRYLVENQVNLTSSLWLYSIHANSYELIDFLETNNVKPEKDSYEGCIIESIKCHHNEIAKYLIEKYFDFEEQNSNFLLAGFQFYNFDYFPSDLNDDFSFYKLCQYGYTSFVEILLKITDLNLNVLIVNKTIFFFLIQFQNKSFSIIFQNNLNINGMTIINIFMQFQKKYQV